MGERVAHRGHVATRPRNRPLARPAQSVHDVERVAQGFVKTCPGELVEAPDRLVIEVDDRDGDDVVAVDDARFGKAVLGSEHYFRSDSTDRSSDRCARDRGEYIDRSVASEHADGSSTSRWSEIGPVDFVASYHAGVVSAASRRADWTSAGSAGWRR